MKDGIIEVAIVENVEEEKNDSSNICGGPFFDKGSDKEEVFLEELKKIENLFSLGEREDVEEVFEDDEESVEENIATTKEEEVITNFSIFFNVNLHWDKMVRIEDVAIVVVIEVNFNEFCDVKFEMDLHKELVQKRDFVDKEHYTDIAYPYVEAVEDGTKGYWWRWLVCGGMDSMKEERRGEMRSVHGGNESIRERNKKVHTWWGRTISVLAKWLKRWRKKFFLSKSVEFSKDCLQYERVVLPLNSIL